MMNIETPRTIHQGRNVKRFREMLGLKQEALAEALGENWSQKKVSMLESKEVIENDILETVAKVLKVPTEAIRNFNEEMAFNVIANTFNDQAVNNMNYHCTFNPIDKIVELYDALLKAEREKIALLEKVIEGKSK